jgi:hypothetical protein
MSQMKTTSNGIGPQIGDYLKFKKWNISDLPQILNFGLCDQIKFKKSFKWRQPSIKDDLKWKTTSNIKNEISQQLLVESSPTFKLKLLRLNQNFQMFQMKTTSSGWQLQISKVKYLSKTMSDLPQIVNVSSVDQTKLYECFKWRPLMEDDFNHQKWFFFISYWSQFKNQCLRDQTIYYKCFNLNLLPMDLFISYFFKFGYLAWKCTKSLCVGGWWWFRK